MWKDDNVLALWFRNVVEINWQATNIDTKCFQLPLTTSIVSRQTLSVNVV